MLTLIRTKSITLKVFPRRLNLSFTTQFCCLSTVKDNNYIKDTKKGIRGIDSTESKENDSGFHNKTNFLVDLIEGPINDKQQLDFPYTKVQSYSSDSFIINNVTVSQPVITFRDSFVQWKVNTIEDITIESLALVPIHFPTCDILFIGIGNSTVSRMKLNEKVISFLRSKGIVTEVSSTFHAASTFNVLVAEGRNVVAALLHDKTY